VLNPLNLLNLCAREYPDGMLKRPVQVSLGATDFITQIAVRGHITYSDEPEESGGRDIGPEPMELLLASLGACTAITLRMYARRKGWSLDGCVLELGFDPDQPQLIHASLACIGDLTDQQRIRLLQIANACPVHKLLASGAMIDTKLNDG
jgi:putative redox protein